MKRIHYSNKPLSPATIIPHALIVDMKPKGLWYSVEDGRGWRDWCEAEDFRLDCLKVATEVVINKKEILFIKNKRQLSNFARSYSRPIFDGEFFPYSYIDWPKVSKKYAGIEIAPYLCECRLNSGTWYYSWDCSSGCIWHQDGIKCIKK